MTAGAVSAAMGSDEIGEIPENLYREPLEALYADHFRAHVACRLLCRVIDAAGDGAVQRQARAVQHFLEHDLPAHFADEEEDLFPLLRARCRDDDRIEVVLALLTEEHARTGTLAEAVVEHLRRMAAGRETGDTPLAKQQAMLFGELHERHLAWENRLLLSLARQRLTRADLSRLGRSMAVRHGARYPE